VAQPPSIQRSNAKHYKAEGTITEVVEYEGRAHLMPSQTGWEEIADYTLSWPTEQAAVWAARPAGSERVTDVRITALARQPRRSGSGTARAGFRLGRHAARGARANTVTPRRASRPSTMS
jgi:hypothetical protein